MDDFKIINFDVNDTISFGGDVEPHFHNEIEFTYIRSGRQFNLICDNSEYSLTSGAFFTAFPNHIHGSTTAGPITHIFQIIVSPSILDESLREIFTQNAPVIPVVYPNDETLTELLQAIHREYTTHSEMYIIKGLLNAFFGKLIKYYKLQNTGITANKYAVILDYCNTHYKEEISLNSVAAALHLNRNYVSAFFNGNLNTGFINYINQLRLDEACRLLENNKITVTEAAMNSGFSSICTFNRVFLKNMGITPLEYKKKKQYVLNLRINKAKKLLEENKNNLQETAVNSGFTTIKEFKNAFYNETGLTPQEYQAKMLMKNIT